MKKKQIGIRDQGPGTRDCSSNINDATELNSGTTNIFHSMPSVTDHAPQPPAPIPLILHFLLALCYLLFVGCDTLEDEIYLLKYKAGSIGQMVQVNGGTFEMGKELGTASQGNIANSHEVTLSSFKISNLEITQEQWAAVMKGNANGISSKPSYCSNNPPEGVQGRRPVEQVSWFDTLVYCNRLSIKDGLTPAYRINGSTDPNQWGISPTSDSHANYALWNAVEIVSGSTGYRLPTEAQWEYAAKGGSAQDPYSYSGSNKINDVAWYEKNGNNRTHEVGKKKPNCLGLYDMTGNVGEWCWDWWEIYTVIPKVNPLGPSSGTSRIHRGGDFWNHDIYITRHYAYKPSDRRSDLGFRLALP